MKKRSLILLSIAALFFLSLLGSCKKINEPTEIGDELIPPIDNINTFETFFQVKSDNVLPVDTTEFLFNDIAALGTITNDPEFGSTNANIYFDISPSTASYPFYNKDSVTVDSVVLSLSYQRAYGDTMSMLDIQVSEIDQNGGFNDTTIYKYTHSPVFQTSGSPLGSKSFVVNTLNDSIAHIRRRDTTKIVSVLRIPLNNSFANRFIDTTLMANSGYRDNKAFTNLFKGFAIKADPATGNALTYFNINDASKTNLTIYYRVQKNGQIDTTSAIFSHFTAPPNFALSRDPANFRLGIANIVKRTPGGEYASYVTNGDSEDDKLFIQSAPGSYATIRIPGLDTLSNNIIHRAELIITRIPTPGENTFIPPVQLLLDRLSPNKDTAYIFDKDLVTSSGLNFEIFGGTLKSNTYRFNITRYVQGIVTKNERNDILRLHAPLRTTLYFPGTTNSVSVPVLFEIANGRVVLAGGNYTNPAIQTKLRVVYSKI